MKPTSEKIPKEFVRAYLKAKGWRTVFHVGCECMGCSIITKHPIRLLWEHASKGHRPYFDMCLTWDRQVGRDTGDLEPWYGWWLATWNPETQVFDVELEEMGIA